MCTVSDLVSIFSICKLYLQCFQAFRLPGSSVGLSIVIPEAPSIGLYMRAIFYQCLSVGLCSFSRCL